MIRDADAGDAPGCLAVYAPYVQDTTVTFEVDVPTVEEMARRIAAAQRAHAWVVLEEDGRVRGYAYAGPFKERPAYRWACEVSVYLEPGRRRRGEGRALYETLFTRLRARGYLRAGAGMTLPNEASEGLHRALGFTPVGTYRRIGWKHGAWRDVAWVQLDLGGDEDPPVEPS